MKKHIFFLCLLFSINHCLFAQRTFSTIGLNIGTNYLIGDSHIKGSKISPNAGAFITYKFSDFLSLKLQTGYGKFKISNSNRTLLTSFIPVELVGIMSIKQNSTLVPFLHAGVGAMSFTLNGSPRFYDGIIIGGAGFTMPISSKVTLMTSADMRYTTGDDFDGNNGGLKDGYFNFQTGVGYNFFNATKQFKRDEIQRKTKIIAQDDKETQKNYVYITQLKSRIANLENDITIKDSELSMLSTALNSKKNMVNQLNSQIEKQKQQPSQNTNMKHQPANELYKNALDNYNNYNYEAAINLMSDLKDKYPDHHLASNFEYWIGECNFALKNYSAALTYFETINTFDKSYKFDDALIMSGICHMRLKDYEKSKQTFEKLILTYSDSEYLERAQQLLASLQKNLSNTFTVKANN